MAVMNAYQQYQESQVLTASKGKLLLMAYDGAIRFIRQAQLSMAEKDYAGQNTNLQKAQRIILELIATLNMKVGGDLAQRLLQLYEYMFNRLVEANVTDSQETLEEVQRLLTDLRSAWEEADRRLAQPGAELYGEKGQHAIAAGG